MKEEFTSEIRSIGTKYGIPVEVDWFLRDELDVLVTIKYLGDTLWNTKVYKIKDFQDMQQLKACVKAQLQCRKIRRYPVAEEN